MLVRFVEFLSTTTAQLVISVAILLVMLVAAYYVVRRFRDRTGDDELTREELLLNYREMTCPG